jgi:hypothetical protein
MHKARFYKKRNLQQAAGLIARFARKYPALFIGVALDPDVYINPFFGPAQRYDYNPATLRQFRHWLSGDGPYAGEGGDGVPDLSAYRRATPFTLAEIDALTGRAHGSWDEVDAPRAFPHYEQPCPKHPWAGVWEQFRRHLVKLHYDELSQWVAEAGIDASRIYSSQGFMPPRDDSDPLPVRLDSPDKNYDTAGVSIEGAVPSHRRLGAIIYGQSAVNRIRMESMASLFAQFRAYSPEWAVVEHNTADLLEPQRLATYAQGYRSLREVANYGARFISPMAWNGSPGEAVGRDDFRAYTALRRAPLEEAITHFMLARADLPRHARLWTFGAVAHADGDGWLVDDAPAAPTAAGALTLRLQPYGRSRKTLAHRLLHTATSALRLGRVTLISPDELACGPGEYQALVVQASMPNPAVTLEVHAQGDDGQWFVLCAATPWRAFRQDAAGAWVPFACADAAGGRDERGFQRIRLIWRGRHARKPLTVRSIALYPRAREPR